MKIIINTTLLILCCIIITAQTSNHLQVQGRVLKGTYNDTIIMKGVNYPVYNYGYTVTENYFDEIAKTKANTVRIVWYKNSTNLPAYNANLIWLDSAFARCKRNKMIQQSILKEIFFYTAKRR